MAVGLGGGGFDHIGAGHETLATNAGLGHVQQVEGGAGLGHQALGAAHEILGLFGRKLMALLQNAQHHGTVETTRVLVGPAGLQRLAIHVLDLHAAVRAGFEGRELLLKNHRFFVAVAINQQYVAVGLGIDHRLEDGHERRNARPSPDEYQRTGRLGAGAEREIAERLHYLDLLTHFHRVEQIIAYQAAGNALHRHGQARRFVRGAAQRIGAALLFAIGAAGHNQGQKLARPAGNSGTVGSLKVNGNRISSFLGQLNNGQGLVHRGDKRRSE